MAQPSAQQKRNTIIIIASIAVIGGGIWLWKDVLEDRLIPKRWGVVEPGAIYRSGQIHPSLIEKMLKKNHIEVIIAMTGEIPGDPEQAAEEKAAQKLGIELKRFPLGGDGTGDINNYAQAITTLVEAQKEGKPTLVHCAAGSQRTGGVIAFYRLLFQNEDPQKVYQEMLEFDWHDTPEAPLVPYINEHMEELVQLLQEMGTLTTRPDPLPQAYSRYSDNPAK